MGILSAENLKLFDDLQDIGGPPTDIATIDGAEYSGDKPKSEKTLVKIPSLESARKSRCFPPFFFDQISQNAAVEIPLVEIPPQGDFLPFFLVQI